MKRITAVLLSMALTVTAVFSMPLTASAGSSEYTDLAAVKGVYYTYYGKLIGPHVYSDELFKRDSEAFDNQMAVLSLNLCQASVNTQLKDFESSRLLREFLTDNGFVDFDVNEDFKKDIDTDEVTTAVACAHKTIIDGGKKYTLLVIAPRSAATKNEWPTGFTMNSYAGDKGDFAGFVECRDKVIEYVRSYINEYGIKGDLKVWISGFSRGAGIINLFAAELIDDPEHTLTSGTHLSADDLYCYTFGCPCAAAASDCRDSRYDYIHNVYDAGDIMANFPFTSAMFDRYGKDYSYSDTNKKDEMLAYLKNYGYSTYQAVTGGFDPDDYTPYKIDVDALLSGELKFVKDENSYLPYDRTEYVRSLADTMAKVEAMASSSGTDTRVGYYNEYQKAAIVIGQLMPVLVDTGLSADTLACSDYGIPMVLSMYATAVIDKCRTDRAGNMNDQAEAVLNQIAAAVEDEKGEVREQYESIESFGKTYLKIRNKYFEKDDSGVYRLRINSANNRYSLLDPILTVSKRITAEMYRGFMTDFLTAQEASQEMFDSILDEDNSEAASYMMAHLLFDNVKQDSLIESMSADASQDDIKELLINNQQIKSMATFVNNCTRLMKLHRSEYMNAWLRINDPYYEVYEVPSYARMSGYRRVYVGQTDGVNVTGSVTDADGATAATFKNGVLTSSTDEWVRITTCDNGSWLRLPAEKSYTVTLKNDSACSYSIKIEEYSIQLEDVARTEDGNGSWSGYNVKAGSIVTVTVPALEELDEDQQYFMMPSDAEYSLSSEEPAPAEDTTVYSPTVPAVKSVSVRASKKSFTAKWKKLSAKQRTKISKVELQYSTSKNFNSDTTVTKMVSKSKSSLKVKKIRKGTKYYVRLRSVRNKNGTKYVSKWSAVKKVKVN